MSRYIEAKWLQDRLSLADECKDCKRNVDKCVYSNIDVGIVCNAIDEAPTIEPNLILPERMERGDIYEVGETIVVMNHDDYYDLLCKSWEPKLGENLNNEYADCDQFICSECGIELRDWTRVEIDEDDGEEDHYEYVFRFCPNCGARIKGADDE